MKLISLLLLTVVAVSAQAQDWAKARLDKSPRHQEWVVIKHGDRELHSLVVYPEVRAKAPVVIVIHEIMGLTEWVQSVGDRLAEAGYIAIVPDFLSGMGPNKGRTTSFPDAGAAREAISGLLPAQVTADLNAATVYARNIPAANGKVAVAGFCWGGTQAFRFATNRQDLAGSFVFYGSGPEDPAAIAKITAPVFGYYGGNDARINATIPGSIKLMEDAKKTYITKTYAEAGHGFSRAGEAPDANEANKRAFNNGWRDWLADLAKVFSR